MAGLGLPPHVCEVLAGVWRAIISQRPRYISTAWFFHALHEGVTFPDQVHHAYRCLDYTQTNHQFSPNISSASDLDL